ncbi:MAG TPA: hypothetical protein V6D20_20090 [Candidatus Obscuribacterales bacterium]
MSPPKIFNFKSSTVYPPWPESTVCAIPNQERSPLTAATPSHASSHPTIKVVA